MYYRYEMVNKIIVICYADYPASHYTFNKSVDEDAELWNREGIEASQKGFCQEITGADRFIFGHTPVPVPQIFANQHYINIGAVVTGNLTLLQIQVENTGAKKPAGLLANFDFNVTEMNQDCGLGTAVRVHTACTLSPRRVVMVTSSPSFLR
ncbi:TPA: hypothetical protein N3282_004324 [Klebsiella aerogenes]|nr:hypothetical protein [Klebsiella aerogenes]